MDIRQNYGLGSFVKKITRKVTKPFTKVASKIVPKEIAGIMRTAAPFLPPGYREAAYLLGTAKQTGRISPMDLALTALPTISRSSASGRLAGTRFGEGVQNIKDTIGGMKIPFTDRSSDIIGNQNKTFKEILVGQEYFNPENNTEGFFGKGGDMYQFGKGKLPGTGDVTQDFGILDTKAGQKLFGTYDKKSESYKPSFTKLGSIGIGLLDLISSAKTAKEAGQLYADSTGNPDDAIDGENLFSQLNPDVFKIQDKFVLKQNAAGGGLMRTNYAMGSEDMGVVNPFQPKPTGPALPEEDKPYTPKPTPKMAGIPQDLNLEKAIRDFIEFNGREPRDMQELLDFFDVKQQAAGGGLMRSNYALGDMAMNQAPSMGMGMGMDMSSNLGSRPTNQESGLGGLPIEADMRYTGGFMPYGEVEKADDVPARLSKNEFVFTADAVRAAGGGSVQQGAKKMYDAMKQLEKQPEAKGAMA